MYWGAKLNGPSFYRGATLTFRPCCLEAGLDTLDLISLKFEFLRLGTSPDVFLGTWRLLALGPIWIKYANYSEPGVAAKCVGRKPISLVTVVRLPCQLIGVGRIGLAKPLRSVSLHSYCIDQCDQRIPLTR